jgi:hypothetical protein
VEVEIILISFTLSISAHAFLSLLTPHSVYSLENTVHADKQQVQKEAGSQSNRNDEECGVVKKVSAPSVPAGFGV